MGKILNGIMGSVSGKIGGVVGARWKDVSYVRSYVKPGMSRTDLQATQRDAFKACVRHAKPFVGNIFNAYYDKFLPRESGFNRFISENIPLVDADGYLAAPTVCSGPLYPTSSLAAVESGSTGVFTVTWSTEHGVDGSNSDVAQAWLRDVQTGEVIFGTPGTRNDGTVNIGNSSWHGRTEIEVGIMFAKMKSDSPTLCLKISNSYTSPIA